MGNKILGSLEKIYTKPELTEFCCDLLDEHYNDPIEFLEPTAGNGAIMDILYKRYPNIPVLGYDIYNEESRSDITQMDYRKIELDYKKGRVAIINPPWTLGLKIIYKTLEFCDIVVAIVSPNTFISIDLEKYDIKEIYFIKKQEYFNNGVLQGHDTSIIIISKK